MRVATHNCHRLPPRKESEMETEEEVDILMSSDVYSATLSTKSITFSRSQIGWLFREDKTVSCGSNPHENSSYTKTENKKAVLCGQGSTGWCQKNSTSL